MVCTESEITMNKIYLAGYFRQNFGDDLFVKVIANQHPSSLITVLVEPQYSKVYNEIKNIKVIKYTIFKRILNKVLSLIGNENFLEKKIIAQSDIIVEIGGSIFQQNGDETITFRRESYLKSGKPIFIIGSNFGPYVSENYYKAYRKYFCLTKGVVFRDRTSLALFNQLSNVSVAPDVVLGLTVNDSSLKVYKHKKKIAVVSVINVVDKMNEDRSDIIQKKYDKKISELILGLVMHNYEVILFGFSRAEHDVFAAERIKNSLPIETKEFVSIKSHEYIDDSLKLMNDADILFSSRFHSMILGWKLQIPQYVFVYSKKTKNVIDDLFPAQASVDITKIDDIGAETLIKGVNTIDKKLLNTAEENARKQFKFLESFLN